MELHLLHPAFCLCYQKPPLRLHSHAPPARDRKPQRTLFTSGSVVLSMNKLELTAEFMPVPCPLADKSPIGFWIRQRPETAQGNFEHMNHVVLNAISSLRPEVALFTLQGPGRGPRGARAKCITCLLV